jgi:hypothetical protein
MTNEKGQFKKILLYYYSVLLAVIFSVFMICGTATATSPEASVASPKVVGNPYELAPGSNFFQGCVGSCMCPVQEVGQIEGTFELIPLRPTPLFTQYRLVNIHWTVFNWTGVVHKIMGSGIYQIGGEVARMHQLILNLSIDGTPIHFNSGLIPDESQFPNIAITVDQGKKCYDIWLDIVANPTATATPPCMKNGDCSLNEFCLFPEGTCSGPGVCIPKPDACPMYCLSPPLCGCDMRAYCNQCMAYSNGVSILSTAGCKQNVLAPGGNSNGDVLR